MIFTLLLVATFAVFIFLEASVLGGTSEPEPLDDAVAMMVAVLFAVIFILELEFWYDAKYFAFCTQKTKLKSVLNAICVILAFYVLSLCLSLFFGSVLIYALGLAHDSALPVMAVYLAIRTIYFVIFKIILSDKNNLSENGVENE